MIWVWGVVTGVLGSWLLESIIRDGVRSGIEQGTVELTLELARMAEALENIESALEAKTGHGEADAL